MNPRHWLSVAVVGLSCTLLQGCGDTARHTAATRLLAAGDTRAALAATSALLADRRLARGASVDEQAFARVNQRLLNDHGIAALVARDLGAAEEAARLLALVGTFECDACADALLGGARHERARLAAVQAFGPEAEPFALSGALVLANSAREAWVRALLRRGSWPAVARNLERLERLVAELEQRRAEAEAARPERESDGAPNVQIVPDAGAGEGPTDSDNVEAATELGPLSPDELRTLVEALAVKERQKLDARRARRARVSSEVERDW